MNSLSAVLRTAVSRRSRILMVRASSSTKIPVPNALLNSSNMNREQYEDFYAASTGTGSDEFWAEQARERLSWMKEFQTTRKSNLDLRNGPISIEWFPDGELNVSQNCIDRHIESGNGDRTAIIWEGDDSGETRHISYKELQKEVSRLANVLKHDLGVEKGDRVSICLPMIPETVFSMLACARIGAVHSVIFGGFSADAVSGRIVDCESKIVITADAGKRGNKIVPLKAIVDEAISLVPPDELTVRSVLVVDRLGGVASGESVRNSRDVSYDAAVEKASSVCEPIPMSSEDPLFILYTSGSTGKPKGVLHTSAGYLLGASMTHEHTFDHRQGDIFWCTAGKWMQES